MKAVVLTEPGVVRVESRKEPALRDPDDVIVRVTLAGICGSDLHIIDGRDRGCRLGTIMGHELCGVVEAVGPAVRGLAVGDRVVAPFTVNCGQCFFCARALPARCERSLGFGFVDDAGRGLEGAQTERVRVPFADASLLKVPDRDTAGVPVDDRDVLFLGDILSTAYGCADNGHIRAGDVVAVVGCGPVGLLCCHVASLWGPAHVVAVDSVPERLTRARAYGAVAVTPEVAAEQVRALTAGRGADVVLEAVGQSAALSLAFDLLRPGGTLSAAGYNTDEHFPLPIQAAYGKNLTLRMGRSNARRHMETLLPLVLSRRLRHREVITHELPLDEAQAGYRIFRERRDGAIKVLLHP